MTSMHFKEEQYNLVAGSTGATRSRVLRSDASTFAIIGNTSTLFATYKWPRQIFLNIPADVEVWRERLFNPQDGLTLTSKEFKKYFPFAANIYKRAKSGQLNKNNVRAEYYECRLFGKASHDKKNREPRRQAQGR
ncbi:hypothetical protein V1507DRAFT_465189 [Lipomyces tetrasporus]